MASLSDPVQRESNKPPIFVMGVLDYQLFQQSLASLVERARKPAGTAETLGTLRARVAGLADKGARDLAATHLDRMESSLSNNRWNRAAAGQILELACVDEAVQLPDLAGHFEKVSPFLYAWNPDVAEHIYTFLHFLSDRTLPWATTVECWRAALPPTDVNLHAEAFGALTPRELGRIMTEAENGEVFGPAETEELTVWWTAVRRVVRLSERLERGVFVATRYPIN
jgi:hypothetical protein